MKSKAASVESHGIDKEHLVADLRRIGVARNDHVAVALSLKNIGFVKDGPDALIDALLEAVGSKGTVMLNTHTRHFPISKIESNYVFDPESSVPLTGVVPRLFLRRQESVRSRHPTCSVAAIGKLADFLTRDHDEYSDPYMPFTRLAQVGGKFLGIGLDGRIVAIRHEAQRRAGLFAVPIVHGVLYRNRAGEIRLFKWILPPCTAKLPQLTPKLERMGVIRSDKIGAATSIIGSVDELLNSMSTILRNDPTLNLCDDVSCVYCRELERRWNLYRRIRNPRFFQRSKFFRQVLALRSKLVLRRYSHISFSDSRHTKLKDTSAIVKTAIKDDLLPILTSICR